MPVYYELGVGGQTAGFLTAQHCLANVNDPVTAGAAQIGRVEFTGDWTFGCSHGTCMHADVGLVQLVNSGLSFVLGGIFQGVDDAVAPYGFWASTYAYSVSLDFGTPKGPFVVDADETPGGEVVGQYFNKIGAVTGWTIGRINNAAIDRPRADGRWIVGTVVVDAGVERGDSGSPVWTGGDGGSGGNPNAVFDGIVWAGEGATSLHNGFTVFHQFDFSPLYKVRQQLTAYGYFIWTH